MLKKILHCRTWIDTVSWLSAAVEKICDFLVGTTELRGMILLIMPPTVSIPKVRGHTSNKTIPSASPSPERTPAYVYVLMVLSAIIIIIY